MAMKGAIEPIKQEDCIAHAARDGSGNWRPPHGLVGHLESVGKLAAEFAAGFGSDWAELAGRWHDLGKFRPRFQRYIRQVSGFEFEADAHIKGEAGKAPHLTAGAMLAMDRFGPAGRVLAYVIAGHHAGLADWFSGGDAQGNLKNRFDDSRSRAELDESLAQSPPADLLDTRNFSANLRAIPGGKDGFALWVRMLFSALVDADFLDTERYMDPDKFADRNRWPDLGNLAVLFDAHMAALSAKAAPTPPVALLASAWIETRMYPTGSCCRWSRSSRARGLKRVAALKRFVA